MTENPDLPDDSSKRDVEFDIPTLPGAFGVWDGLVEKYGEPLVGIGREVLQTSDNGIELSYQFAVAAAFLDIQRDSAYGGNGIGYESGNKRRLKEAMSRVADRHSVTRERVRQACTQAYNPDNEEMTEQFLDDLLVFEARLEEWHEQNPE